MKKVILDVLGGDNAPQATIDGAMMALDRDPDLNLILVGDEKLIPAHPRIEVIHTTTNIEMNESPTNAIMTKKDSSIVLGMEALRKRDDTAAFVSAGSTGAVLTGAFMKVGRIPGISRPALCAQLMTVDKKGVLVLDLGANMDCKSENLVHFAIMADIYMKERGVKSPRIALLNVGTEDEKGNELTKETFKALSALKDSPVYKFNFVGNMEARDTFSGKYDIVVTDGFAGNVLLKTLEGTGRLFSHELKKAMRGFPAVIGKIILAPKLLKMKKTLSEDATGGAIFLGIKKPVIKAHGNSNPTALCNAILLGARTANMNLSEQLEQKIKLLSNQ